MVFGYARVSTAEQSLDLQLDALLKEGIEQKNIYTDKVSSTKEERKSLVKLLNYVRSLIQPKNHLNLNSSSTFLQPWHNWNGISLLNAQRRDWNRQGAVGKF